MDETLRSVLAVRPDAVMLSHVPDRTTALMATQLASSLLVLPSLTAQTAAGAVSAFVELGVPAPLLATCLSAVTCQRLVRTICRICRQPAEPPAPQTLAHHGLGADEAATLRFFKGRGCPTCNTVGYRGRRAVFEVMPGSPEVRARAPQRPPGRGAPSRGGGRGHAHPRATGASTSCAKASPPSTSSRGCGFRPDVDSRRVLFGRRRRRAQDAATRSGRSWFK